MLSDPNREYVALCWSSRLIDGKQEKYFYTKKFKLPPSYKETAFAFGAIDIEIPLENTANKASWYFLNKLDYQAAVELVIPASQYENITPSKIISGLIEALSNDLSSKDIVEQLRSDLPTLTTYKLNITTVRPAPPSEDCNNVHVEGTILDPFEDNPQYHVVVFQGTLGFEKEGRDGTAEITVGEGYFDAQGRDLSFVIDDPFQIDWDHIWDNEEVTEMINQALESTSNP